jgi:hypothetical protein
MGNIVSISTIGQDSHRFGEPAGDTTIKLGGIDIPFDKPILANSDGDVVYHAITNAISGFTGVNILGGEADKICLEKGIKDSAVYLNKALEYHLSGIGLGINSVTHTIYKTCMVKGFLVKKFLKVFLNLIFIVPIPYSFLHLSKHLGNFDICASMLRSLKGAQ